MKIRIKHPMADTMSVVSHSFAYSSENTSEVAFFRNGDWVVDPIPHFAPWHDGSPSDADTAVYGWVPAHLVDEFVAVHQS